MQGTLGSVSALGRFTSLRQLQPVSYVSLFPQSHMLQPPEACEPQQQSLVALESAFAPTASVRGSSGKPLKSTIIYDQLCILTTHLVTNSGMVLNDKVIAGVTH